MRKECDVFTNSKISKFSREYLFHILYIWVLISLLIALVYPRFCAFRRYLTAEPRHFDYFLNQNLLKMKTQILILSFFACMLFTGKLAKASLPGTDPQAALEAPGGSDLIADWITVHNKAIRNSKIPSQHFRQYAYTGVALYESIVAGDQKYKPLAGQLNEYTSPKSLPDATDICWQASANAAISKMLHFFYAQDQISIARFDSLEKAWNQRLMSENNKESAIMKGTEYGRAVAEAVIEWGKTDGADKASDAYEVPKGPGLWEPTPPKFTPPIIPYMGKCRTLVKGSIDKTIPNPPTAFSTEKNSPFYKMVDEVYQASLTLDEKNKAMGLFWDDFPDSRSVTAAGHWACILKTIMKDRHTSLMEGSMLYAGLFIAELDASIGCFKAKYTYNLIRPVSYIQKYMAHPDWSPLINTPSHPEYPAAHATVSMAGATILTHLLGDHVAFTDDTYGYMGYKARQFASIREAGKEAGMSRFYGGIHYIPSIEAGAAQGEKVATNVAKSLVFKN
jgi:hypothetical protein